MASTVSVNGAIGSSGWLDASGCSTGTLNVTDFGAVPTGVGVVTTLDCTVLFGANNSSMLRLYQRDGGGQAMLAGPATGSIAYWPLNGSASDIDGTDQAWTLASAPNDPSYVAGQAAYGQAINLDGNDYATSADPALSQSGDLSISMWFRGTGNSAYAWNTMLMKSNMSFCAAPDCNYALEWRTHSTATVADDDLVVDVSDAGCSCTKFITATDVGSTYLDGAWHHVAMTVDVGGNMVLYLDGAQFGAPLAVTGPLMTNAANTILGASSATGPQSVFAGDIDEVHLTNTARTAADIRAEYLGRVSDYSNTVDDWDTPGDNTFGACLRRVTNGASDGGTAWTQAPGNLCDTTDGAWWHGIPATSPGAKVAYVAAPDLQGGATDPGADLRFGFRTKTNQAAGTYLAPLTFETIAPDA